MGTYLGWIFMGCVGPVVSHSTANQHDMNFSGHKKWISEAPFVQGMKWYPERVVDIPVHHMLAAHETGNELVSPRRPKC